MQNSILWVKLALSISHERYITIHIWFYIRHILMKCLIHLWESVCLEKHIVRKKVYTTKNNVLWLLLCLIHQRLWPLWPLFTQRTDVLLQDLVKSRSSKMRDHAFPIAIKFHRYLDSSAARCLSNFRVIRSLSRGIISSRGFETSRNY